MNKNSIAKIIGDDTAYDIIVIAGQSNAEGNGRSLKTTLFPYYRTDSDIKMLKRIPHIVWKKVSSNKKVQIIKYTNFYSFKDAAPYRPGNYGFSLFFADLYKEKYLREGRKILLLSTAIGGTSFCCNHWGKGEPLSENAVFLAQEALKANPNNSLKCVLWHQGESDSDIDLPENYYYDKLKEFVEDFRASFSDELVFIFGDMQQDWKKTMPNSYITSDATRKIVSELNNTAFVESDGLAGNVNDIIHFSKAAQEELGKRYFSAYSSIVSDNKQGSL